MTTDKKLGLTRIAILAVLTAILGATQASAQVGTSVYDNIPAHCRPTSRVWAIRRLQRRNLATTSVWRGLIVEQGRSQ